MKKWNEFLNYFVNIPVGTIVERQDILLIGTGGCYVDKNDTASNIDQFRNILTKCGFLEKITKGKYKLTKPVDINITMSEAKKIAYDYEYRTNYNRFTILKNILEEYEDQCNNGEFPTNAE